MKAASSDFLSYPSSSRLNVLLGNFFEHYDTALFGFLSVFLAPILFPQVDEVMALILTYAIIPLGMLARPIGALFFGYIGDTYGRHRAVAFSLGGMALVSGFIAFSPTYQQVGFLVPVCFSVARIVQNFLVSGEAVGGALLLMEDKTKKNEDFLSALYNMTTIGGILLASAGVSLISYFGMIEWGWRALYLIGCITAFFAFSLRREPLFVSPAYKNEEIRFNWKESLKTCWKYRLELIQVAVVSGFSYATYSVALVLLNGFVPLVSSVTQSEMTYLNTLLLILDFLTLPLFGWLCLKTGRQAMMLAASFGTLLLGAPLIFLLSHASLMTVIGVRIVFVVLGVAFFAPFYSWAKSLVGPTHRYLVLSFGYAIGSQFLGGPTSTLSLWLFHKTGMPISLSWYWLLLAFLSTIVLLYSNEAKEEI